jgi:putative hemolysin
MRTALSSEKIFKLPSPFRDPRRQKVFAPIGSALERLLCLTRCERIYASLQPAPDPAVFPARVLEALNVTSRLAPGDLERIPPQGPVIVVANHPFGAIEGIILTALIQRVRPDVRVMANYLLGRVPPMRNLLIPVDPFGGEGSARKNLAPLRESLRWLEKGGVLVIFPAGEVSHLNLRHREISDPPWHPNLAGIVRKSRAPVLPVFFPGGNGPLFQLAGLLHPRLRTALLPRELLNKGAKTIPVRIGTLIPARKLAEFASDREMADYLRLRTYLLGNQKPAGDSGRKTDPVPGGPTQEPVIPARDPALLRAEVESLPAGQILVDSGPYLVLQAQARQIPHLLLEIGRLREITFRAAEEGTGRSLDLDRFDEHYTHIFIWNREAREVVGAYRVGRTDEILGRFGREGLYTSTLFRYRPGFPEKIGPALELGRSFVRPEYQKTYAPLLLLWRGIGRFVAENPLYRILFGPVSINRRYGQLSRQMIVSSLQQSRSIPELARLVRPKTPLRLRPVRIKGCDSRTARTFCRHIEDVSAMIVDLHVEEGGIPVLLRHYLNLGGRLLAFNLDPDFSDVLDGLILVDLVETEKKSLERYLGKEGAAGFLAYHRPAACPDRRCA